MFDRQLVCSFVLSAAALIAGVAPGADPAPQAETVRLAVTGLFDPLRVDELRELVETIPDLTLVSVDFDRAEATFRCIPEQLFPGVKPDKLIERFDNLLRTSSFSTFGARPLSTVPADQLERIEIGILGLDCRACSLGAYDAVYRLDGVERATASFKQERLIAWIDPRKTNRAALEAALTQRRVPLKMPTE